MHFVYIFLTLIAFVLLAPGHCKPTRSAKKTSMTPMIIEPTSISPGNLTICEDFVHVLKDNDSNKRNGSVELRGNGKDAYKDNRDNGGQVGLKEKLQDLIIMNWTKKFKTQFRRFTKKHVPCKTAIKKLRKQRVENYFEVDHSTSRNMTSMMEIYTEVTKISLLLRLLKSEGAKQCCLEDKKLTDLYWDFKNEVRANLYFIVSEDMADWTGSDCSMKITPLSNEPMRCEDVAHVIAIVLNDAAVKSKALRKKIKAAEKNLLP